MKGEDRVRGPVPAGDFNRKSEGRRLCLLVGCERPVKGRGLCARHLRRWSLYGDPLAYAPPKPERVAPTREEVIAEMTRAYEQAKEVTR